MGGEVGGVGTAGSACISGLSVGMCAEKGCRFHGPGLGMEAIEEKAAGSNADLTARHARNFLDCVRSREEPNADVEIGHRSTTLSLLGNISLATGLRLEWDAATERITNDKAANELLHYDYRKPWTLG